jgi:hypothetical protein
MTSVENERAVLHAGGGARFQSSKPQRSIAYARLLG